MNTKKLNSRQRRSNASSIHIYNVFLYYFALRGERFLANPTTISDQINEVNEKEISYNTLHPKLLVTDINKNTTIRVPYSSYVSQYREFLSTIIVEEELDKEGELKYWFKPKSLSNDLYGTTELWDTILTLNECSSATTFKPTKVKYYDPDLFKDYLNEIMLLENAIKY